MKKQTVEEANSFQPTQLNHNDIRKMLKESMDVLVLNIQKIMKERNMSQRDLAFAILSDQQHISYIFRKKKGITYNVICRISKALDIPVYQLVK